STSDAASNSDGAIESHSDSEIPPPEAEPLVPPAAIATASAAVVAGPVSDQLAFIAELREYHAASGISEAELLFRILLVALTGSAAAWRRRQPPFLTRLRSRTQHRDESLAEFVRALQTLHDRADPSALDSNKVSRAIRQGHPQFHPFLRGRAFRDLDELAHAAHQIQEDILAERSYRPPPPSEACLEPSCAWTGNIAGAVRRSACPGSCPLTGF
ncbi:unnamed protein product, partial [Ixodes hexagonus]